MNKTFHFSIEVILFGLTLTEARLPGTPFLKPHLVEFWRLLYLRSEQGLIQERLRAQGAIPVCLLATTGETCRRANA